MLKTHQQKRPFKTHWSNEYELNEVQAFTQQSNARVTENWTVIEDAMVTRQISAPKSIKIERMPNWLSKDTKLDS
jgi:hypothetical protein